MLTFVKDYKKDEGLRQSFDALAKNTFGISFEAWYQNGCWDDNYITYSFHDAGKIIANASANRMTLKIEGLETPVSAMQIGTVMTDPAYRRKGLAFALIQKIFDDFDGEVSLYYLAANLEAIPLYEKCGFIEVPETCYHYVISKASGAFNRSNNPNRIVSETESQTSANETHTLRKTALSLEEFIQWKRRAIPKGSQFDVIDDAHIAAFYWFHGFNDMLYTLGDDCLILADFSEERQTMTLYEYYMMDKQLLNESSNQTDEMRLDTIISAVLRMPDRKIEQIDFAFDVTGMQLMHQPLSSSEDNRGWMTRSLGELRFPETFCYPKLAQA